MTPDRYAELLAAWTWTDRDLTSRRSGRISRKLGISKAEAKAFHTRYREVGGETGHRETPAAAGETDRSADRSASRPHDEGQAVEVLALKDELRAVRKLLRDQRRDDALAKKIRQTAFGLADAIVTPPKWIAAPDRVAGSAGVPTLMLSDLHWGEVVRPSEVFGVNEYDLDTARRRLRRVTDTAIELLRDVVVSPSGYPGIVVCLGGDMVSGGIHEELLATDELPPAACVVDLLEHMTAALRLLADEFGRVFVPCVTGNHGRTTRKTWKKMRTATSWDWMLYTMLERQFAGDDRIRFAVSEDTDILYTVAGKRYLLTHGDELGVRGGNGIIGSLGPIMRGRHKIASANANLGREHDVLVMGHWHQHIALRHVIVNSSLKGYDEYARASRFSFEPPSQALWITHPAHGVTISMPVFASDPPKREGGSWDWAA